MPNVHIATTLALLGLSIPCFAQWSRLMHPEPTAPGWARAWLLAGCLWLLAAAIVAADGFGVEWFRAQPLWAYLGGAICVGVLTWLWTSGTPINPPSAANQPTADGGGGRGGNAKVTGSGMAIGGRAGRGGSPGTGRGGDGGSAEVGGDGFALGGEGGEAGQPNRAARGGRGPAEVLGMPKILLPDGRRLWDVGRGGDGGFAPPDQKPSPDSESEKK
jgi:hypothetical protein